MLAVSWATSIFCLMHYWFDRGSPTIGRSSRSHLRRGEFSSPPAAVWATGLVESTLHPTPLPFPFSFNGEH